MKFLINIIILFLIFNSKNVFSKNIYNTDFENINIITNNAEATKKNSIDSIKYSNFLLISERILDNDNKNKLFKKIQNKNFVNKLIQNIIIENEIITNEKYIADIKVNFNKKKIINLLRNEKINYSDFISPPFLIISTFENNFINAGIEKDNIFLNFISKTDKNNNHLIDYMIPNMDKNDKYLLPFSKILYEDKISFNSILNKYKTQNLLIVSISNKKNNIYLVNLKSYNQLNNKINIIDNFEVILKEESLEQFYFNLTNNILDILNKWWKKRILINNSELNSIECLIISNSLDEYSTLNNNINDISQIKSIFPKKIKINHNVKEIYYYGNIEVFKMSLHSKDIYLKNTNNCIISNNP